MYDDNVYGEEHCIHCGYVDCYGECMDEADVDELQENNDFAHDNDIDMSDYNQFLEYED